MTTNNQSARQTMTNVRVCYTHYTLVGRPEIPAAAAAADEEYGGTGKFEETENCRTLSTEADRNRISTKRN